MDFARRDLQHGPLQLARWPITISHRPELNSADLMTRFTSLLYSTVTLFCVQEMTRSESSEGSTLDVLFRRAASNIRWSRTVLDRPTHTPRVGGTTLRPIPGRHLSLERRPFHVADKPRTSVSNALGPSNRTQQGSSTLQSVRYRSPSSCFGLKRRRACKSTENEPTKRTLAGVSPERPPSRPHPLPTMSEKCASCTKVSSSTSSL